MSPFLEFRSWLRDGPRPERALAAVTGVLLLALVAWAVIPNIPSDSTTVASVAGVESPAAPAPAAPASGAVTPTGPAGAPPTSAAAVSTAPQAGPGIAVPSAVTSTAGGAPSTAVAPTGATRPSSHGASSSSNAACPVGATDKGVTATTITIGVIIYTTGSANSLINLPAASDWEKAYTAVFNAVNAKGGLACRKLVPKFYVDNVLDSNSEHSLCLQAAQDKVFALFNNPFATAEQTCPAKQHIPDFWATPPHTHDVAQYVPYILSYQPDFDRLIHLYVRGAHDLGWFTGMKKLGIIEQSCFPDENTDIANELSAIGIDPHQASIFNYGCSSAPVNSPLTDSQAAIQFKNAGVTHVMNVGYASDVGFSNAADGQHFFPKFAHMEDASGQAIASGVTKPGKSYDGTLLIETIPTGGPNTPGYTFSPANQTCASQLASVGLPSQTSSDVAKFYGLACVDMTMFVAAVSHAPQLVGTQLSTGLSRAGTLDLAYPSGPLTVTDPARPTGGTVFEPAQWYTACECWRITDPHFRPASG